MVWKNIKSSLPGKFLALPAQAERSIAPDASTLASSSAAPAQAAASQKPKPRSATSAWALACNEYQAQLKVKAPPEQSVFFSKFGPFHLALAELLIDRHQEIAAQGKTRVVHIAGTAGLLAVYCPAERLVQLRTQPTALGQIVQMHDLVLRVMPQSAQLLEGDAARGFQLHTCDELMWYFGQSDVQAFSHMPDAKQQILSVRRFPLLRPECLLLRHLRLLHILSQTRHTFETLLPVLGEEQLGSICPDLAALYLTGALSLRPA